MYNTQQLLFDKSQKVNLWKHQNIEIPESFYRYGYAILKNISTPEEAQQTAEIFLANLDLQKLPFYKTVNDSIQLAKADAIPVCDDSVETSFQALHFDMGQAMESTESQLMITGVALYHPLNTLSGTAKTRILPLRGLLKNTPWKQESEKEIEKRIIEYVNQHGDGWDNVNTRRLICFARVIDAISKTEDLIDLRDKTMAAWFKNKKNPSGLISLDNEINFYKLRGLDLNQLETQITLLPGQILIMDNTRAVHGRIGKRTTKEIYQFMFGLQATPEQIVGFRKNLIRELTNY